MMHDFGHERNHKELFYAESIGGSGASEEVTPGLREAKNGVRSPGGAGCIRKQDGMQA